MNSAEDSARQGGSRRIARGRWLLPIAAAAILMLLVVLNGFPLLYDDTTAYMRRSAGALVALGGPGFASEWLDPERLSWLRSSLDDAPGAAPARAGPEGPPPWTGGRSVYYGFIAHLLALAGGLWASVAFQALIAGVLLAVAWFRVLGLRSVSLFLAACLLLTFASSLGYFVGLVMPDVFAGFTILAFGMLMVGWDRLGRAERATLAGIAAFSLLAHDTHLLLGAGLLGAFLIFSVLGARTWRLPAAARQPGAALAACLVLGVLGSLAYNLAAVRISGQPPLRLPHITAHMASVEPGVRFLRERCPREAWAVCDHADELPLSWIEFMFTRPEVYDQATPERKRRLSDEQLEVAGAMLADRPLATVGLAATEAARQLVTFSYFDLGQREMLAKNVPASVIGKMRGTALVENPGLTMLLSNVQQVVVVISALLLLPLVLMKSRVEIWSRARALTAIMLLGVVLNAAICGVLAYPYDRFQARVVWLVPLMALLWLALLVERRNRGRSAAGSSEAA